MASSAASIDIVTPSAMAVRGMEAARGDQRFGASDREKHQRRTDHRLPHPAGEVVDPVADRLVAQRDDESPQQQEQAQVEQAGDVAQVEHAGERGAAERTAATGHAECGEGDCGCH